MWLVVGNVDTRVARATDDELKWLHYRMSLPSQGRYKTVQNESLFNPGRMTFPTGMLSVVTAEAEGMGFPRPDVADSRKRPCTPRLDVNLGWLKDFQEEAVLACLKHGQGVVQIATGGGKGELLAALCALLPCRWLVTVKPVSLISELRDRIELRFKEQGILERVGTIGENTFDAEPRVVVAGVDALNSLRGTSRSYDFFRKVEAVAADEAHQSAATSFKNVLRSCAWAFFRFGFSATPSGRSDGRDMVVTGALGPVIFKAGIIELANKGVVARGEVRMLQYTMRDPYDRADLTWDDFYEQRIARDSGRNERIAKAVRASKGPVLVLVTSLVHGEILTLALHAHGLKARFVEGDDNLAFRDASLRSLDKGELDVLVSTKIFNAGANVPNLATVVNAAGGKASIPTIQGAGRGSRRLDRTGTAVKDDYVVVDLFDRGCGACLRVPIDEMHAGCRWVLTHSKARKKAYTSVGYPVETVDTAKVV